MLNDFLDLFLGACYNYISPDYPNREYFACILCIVVLGILCAAVFGLVLILVHGTFKAIRGALK